ncbi:protein GRAVITROPIC IN THE LIGHT 1-like [Andrographis paniculata]|uniref:protein GRAVITROPIC IN THE LIGHT 1-like n=1 Tax=Andrographis paniculata TaxID=175694 RepID=UPI0021E7CCC8|nr:protein GRAVITROPIC IN THE LIGHT 1-like [Andrographis paniculata]
MDLDDNLSNNKSRLSGPFSKVFRVQAASGVPQDEGMKRSKTLEKTNSDVVQKSRLPSEDENDEAVRNEAFFAQLFASISTVKAAYAQLQFSQSPYDADGIQSADQMIVSELKNVSTMKQNYLQKPAYAIPPETSLLLSEIQEQKNLLKIYEITGKKLESQLKLKDDEITSLKKKLCEAERGNKVLEKKVNASGQLVHPENIRLSDLQPSHFVAYFRHMLKSVRSFVRLLIGEMESTGWNMDDAACSIEPDVSFWKPSHKCYAFESFVCKKMFDGFNNSNPIESMPNQGDHCGRQFFERFTELKSVRPKDYISRKPKSPFATYCRRKYAEIVHPKMEASLFGNLGIRDSADSINFPDAPCFSAFIEMAKRVWVLRCLSLSFDPPASIFQAGRGSRFCEVYMESLSDEAFLICDSAGPEADPRVAFTVVPGFKIGPTVIQCQVYLRR